MSTHTHRGHCQCCLRVQAIDTQTGLIAKHGYDVVHGYFNGTCPGSSEPSLHISRALTDGVISRYFERAQAATAKVEELKAGTCTPLEAWNGEYVKAVVKRGNRTYTASEMKIVPFAECSEEYQLRAVKTEIYKSEATARHSLMLKQQMQEWAAKIFDNKAPAYRVEDLESRDWKVGDTARIGGKKGFDAVIEAIEDRPYTTRGFRRGFETIMCPHGRITRPARPERRSRTGIIEQEARDANQLWEPLRHIKRPKSPLVQSLTKAGLL